MSTQIVEKTSESVTIQVTIPFSRSMLESEVLLQEKLNEVGVLATGEILSQFDTDGSPIEVGGVRFTSKGRFNETYQTPYGQVGVVRHVYQSSAGGRTFCPLEREARLVLNSTPRFAKIVSFKYACFGANMVTRDLLENHERLIAHGYVKSLADMVGSIAQAKEESWNYALPNLLEPVTSIGIGLDGTCMYMREDGWREAMTGSISLYDRMGERLHTIYVGATPEYGKETFLKRFALEIERIQRTFSDAKYVGLADGASDNWDFLAAFVDRQVLDFWHASGYVGTAAEAIFGSGSKKKDSQRMDWVETSLHDLKHKYRAAEHLLEEMKSRRTEVTEKARKESLEKVITYFENHHHQMWYSRQVRQKMPIGSGVTEAACKILVKQRLCQAGMRWKQTGAASILSVRALVLTVGRWEQFWSRISQYGIPT